MLKIRINKLSFYITRELIKKILIILISIAILVFIIDFSELAKDARDNEAGVSIALKIALLKLPTFIETSLQFIVLLSALFTFAKLSKNSEMIVMKISKLSVFQLLKVPVVLVFLIGAFSITVINPISSFSNKYYKRMENKYFKNETEVIIESLSGLWFRQKNLVVENEEIKEKGEIIIRANKVYADQIIFNNAILTYTDSEGNFLQRMNVKKLKFDDNGFWFAKDIYVMKEKERAEYHGKMIIPTNLDRDFISKKIKNDYEALENISFWELPNLIKDATNSGLDAKKFRIRFLYLLSVPFVFVSMVYFAAYFAINNERLHKSTIMIMAGILTGFIIYISHNVLVQLAGSGKVSIFNAVFAPVILYLIIGLFLIIKKEELLNCKIFKFK